METNTCVNVALDTRYISFGVEVDGEISFIDVNLISNPRYWGATVVDWNGNSETHLGHLEDDGIGMFEIDNNEKKIFVSVSKGRNDISILVSEE